MMVGDLNDIDCLKMGLGSNSLRFNSAVQTLLLQRKVSLNCNEVNTLSNIHKSSSF